MVLSCNDKKAAIKHILEKVLDQDPDSNIHCAIDYAAIVSPHDLYTLPIDMIDELKYKADNDTFQQLSIGHRNLLKAFRYFVLTRNASNNPITDSDWTKITRV